jgi:hypothetical protein
MTIRIYYLVVRPDETLLLPIPENEGPTGNFEIELIGNENDDYLFTRFCVREYDQDALIKLRNHINELIELNKDD